MLRWRLPPCESALAAFSRNCALTLTTMFHRKDHQFTEKEMRERHGTGRSEANLSRTDPSEKGLSGTDPSQKGLSRTDTSEKGLSGAYSCQASTLNGPFNICGFVFVCCSALFFHIRIVFVCCSACLV